jgi:ATP-dependent DNA ligase
MPVEPMLAAPTAVFPTGKALRGAWFEPKWDGYRAMVSTTATAWADGGVDGRDGGGGGAVAHVWSRRGHDITRAFPTSPTQPQSTSRPGTSWTESSSSGATAASTSVPSSAASPPARTPPAWRPGVALVDPRWGAFAR